MKIAYVAIAMVLCVTACKRAPVESKVLMPSDSFVTIASESHSRPYSQELWASLMTRAYKLDLMICARFSSAFTAGVPSENVLKAFIRDQEVFQDTLFALDSTARQNGGERPTVSQREIAELNANAISVLRKIAPPSFKRCLYPGELTTFNPSIPFSSYAELAYATMARIHEHPPFGGPGPGSIVEMNSASKSIAENFGTDFYRHYRYQPK